MDSVNISHGGAVFTYLNITCQRCDKPATVIIQPDFAPDFYACDEHKQETIQHFLANLPRK